MMMSAKLAFFVFYVNEQSSLFLAISLPRIVSLFGIVLSHLNSQFECTKSGVENCSICTLLTT